MPTDRNGNYRSGSTADSQYDANAEARQGDTILDQIPLLRGLTGASSRLQQYQDAQAADANRGYWDTLSGPSAGALDSQEGRDAESRALEQMGTWSNGGLTGADRGALESSRARDAQAAHSAQQSLQQQAQARGVGGSGLDFATRQQASQLGQQQSSDAEAQALLGAQQRGLAATQYMGQLGGRLRQEELQGPLQQEYENELERAAGATGQYGTDSSVRAGTRRSADDREQGTLGFIGELLG